MQPAFDSIFAVTAPGLEEVTAREIRRCTGRDSILEKGGVTFSGSLEDLYRVNLWSRTASRVVVRVGSIRATDFPDLHRRARRLPWGRFIRPDAAVSIRATSRRSRLNHTRRLAETLSDAIDGALGRLPPAADDAGQLVIARMEDDVCVLSVDSSGALLHRRGYRTEASKAPLRETLAAGMLQLLGWDGRTPLCDPMCGSGTFLIEAAQIATGMAPGMQREFAFRRWPRYRDGLWRNLVDSARRSIVDCPVSITGSDADPAVIELARRNAERAGCVRAVRIAPGDMTDATELPVPPPGLVICNPPYGVRLGDRNGLAELYRTIGRVYSRRFKGWQGALFCPSGELVDATGLDLRPLARFSNGGVETTLFGCRL